MSPYDKNLDKNAANYVPLTPLSFLERANDVYPNYEAIVYEDRKYTWNEVYKRAIKFASALEKISVSSSGKKMKKANHATAHMFFASPFGDHGKKSVGFMNKLFSTHPPLEERIVKLRGLEIQ